MTVQNGSEPLRNFWYLAMRGRRLKRRRMVPRTRLGEPVLLGRTTEGAPFAIRDLCPHRGMPLHQGEFDGHEVACCYYGWKFRPDGGCSEVPSLLPDQAADAVRIRVKSYTRREAQGNIWVFMTLDGSTNLAQEAERLSSRYSGDVRVASLEADSPEWDEVPSRSPLGTIAVSSLVTRADRVISIPVAKTHAWAQLTLSLKNFVGVTPLRRYGEWREPGYWDRGRVLDHSSTRSIAQIYLDIVAAVKPDLAVIDFSYGVEGDGPTTGAGEGQTVDVRSRLGSWLVLASTDLVAADATAARVMSHDVDSITQLRMARDMGLGAMSQGRIEMVGERLDDLRVEWRRARLKNRLARCPFGVPAYAQGPSPRLGHRTG